MTKRMLNVGVVAGLLVMTAAATGAGGWSIVTVDDLPEYLIAGQTTRISYTVRQHGQTLRDDLAGSIVARQGGNKVTGLVANARGVDEEAHVLDHAEDGDVDLLAHGDALVDVVGGDGLRGGDHDRAGELEALRQGERDVSRPGREVSHEPGVISGSEWTGPDHSSNTGSTNRTLTNHQRCSELPQ